MKLLNPYLIIIILSAVAIPTVTILYLARAYGDAVAPGPAMISEVRNIVNPPRPAPNFQLIDQFNRTVRLSDHRGKVVILYFAYLNCPDICPLQNQYINKTLVMLGNHVGDVAVMMVTVDPDRDSPRALYHYSMSKGYRWLFLTGSPAELERVWKEYNVYRVVQRFGNVTYVIHSADVYIIDRDGLIRIWYRGIINPETLINDVESLLRP